MFTSNTPQSTKVFYGLALELALTNTALRRSEVRCGSHLPGCQLRCLSVYYGGIYIPLLWCIQEVIWWKMQCKPEIDRFCLCCSVFCTISEKNFPNQTIKRRGKFRNRFIEHHHHGLFELRW